MPISEGVSWHNNDAERAIRKGVLHRKISGGKRTWTGAEYLKCHGLNNVTRTRARNDPNSTNNPYAISWLTPEKVEMRLSGVKGNFYAPFFGESQGRNPERMLTCAVKSS